MTRNARPITAAQYALTRDERAQIFDRFGLSISTAAKAFGVGDETYRNIMDPHGRVSLPTITKIREKLKEMANDVE